MPGPRPIASASRDRDDRTSSGVMRSSLELVFSYSRSQQLFFGSHLPSAPSFMEYDPESPHDHSPSSGSLPHRGRFGSRRRSTAPFIRRGSESESGAVIEDSGEGEDEEDEEDEDETTPGQTQLNASQSPTEIFRSDFVLNRGLQASAVDSMSTSRTGDGRLGGPTTPSIATTELLRSPLPGLLALTGRSSSNPSPTTPKQDRPKPEMPSIESSVHEDDDEAVEMNDGPTERSPLLANERTPLIKRDTSPWPSRRSSMAISSPGPGPGSRSRRTSPSAPRKSSLVPPVTKKPRRKSELEILRGERGISTDGQTLFNAVAVLVGIGLLSLPLAFSYAGWLGGSFLLIGFAALTNYTAKILARLIMTDPSLRGYSDLGRRSFGKYARTGVDILFCTELFALSVALVVLFGDSLHAVLPHYSSNTYKLIGFFIILPTTLVPLHLLSLPSLLSTLSTLGLIVIILIDGFIKPEAPGSLRQPNVTHWMPEWYNGNVLGGVGLILAGFGGHAVVPSLVRDMRNPASFDRVINKAYIIATVLSFIAGGAGYMMMGDSVSDEITQDLMLTKYHYPRALNIFATWMIVVNPLTKFGLCTRPLNITLETILNITPAVPVVADMSEIILPPSEDAPRSRIRASFSAARDAFAEDSDLSVKSGGDIIMPGVSAVDLGASDAAERRKSWLRVLSRSAVTAVCTGTAVALPGFGRLMAFLGSCTSFLICVILPLMFYRILTPPERRSKARDGVHGVIFGVSVLMMIAGTVWAFLPFTGRD